MANSYFQFKQFRIDQSGCAMKVTTDASLFGAWIASQSLSASSALDIGGGTGLLSLMLAQKNSSTIDIIEVEKQCFEQMKQNIEHSPWHDSIHCILKDINDFSSAKTYDLIISNPPFHQGQLRSDRHAVNLARHGDELTLDLLLKKVNELLSPEGKFFLLTPAYRDQEVNDKSQQHGMFIQKKAFVKQSAFHDSFRVMYAMSKTKSANEQTEYITIKNKEDGYTAEFSEYLKDYYIYL